MSCTPVLCVFQKVEENLFSFSALHCSPVVIGSGFWVSAEISLAKDDVGFWARLGFLLLLTHHI